MILKSRLCVLLFLLAGVMKANAQYFQQQADFTISASLDTRQHMLRGQWEMVYRNNSPDTLQMLFIHLYPNAYSSQKTAFAKQQLRLGIYDFHFAKPSELGGIDSLNFTIDGSRIPWSLDKEHPDIALLNLMKPLLPGQSINITSPIRIKIPKAFSRLGRIDDSYQITQWYPKPAVYDLEGWHPLPYLSQGEFYSEFGSVNVNITLPANYLVAATGELQTPEAIRLLDSLAISRNRPLNEFPLQTHQARTWQYRAENVHDFAWFADTRFAVRKETIRIGDKDVICQSFFTTVEQELWEHATEYLGDALQFYSNHIGAYPYPQMTAVQVPLGRDFGMEYPMITSINLAGNAKLLDDVLTHEVGHNWFYGVLATNERNYPWMDEGINTFYEFGYLREKYQDWSEQFLLHKPAKPHEMSDEQRVLQHMTREKQLVAPETDPELMSEWQTFFGAYFKPALAFDMLQEYMGEDGFANAMKEYFATWKFRHPLPFDLKEILSKHCSCNLNWLFDDLIRSDQLIDYRISEFDEGRLTIQNRGNISAPVHLIAYRDTTAVFTEWHDGFEGQQEFHIDIQDADRLQVYDEIYSLDATPSDNIIWLRNGRAGHAKLKVRMLGGKEYPGERYLNLLPVFAWNHADKAMFGLAVSNTYWPPRNLQWAIVPLYSIKTRSLTGAGEIQYRLPRPSAPQSIELGLGIRSFHFAHDTHYGFYDRYSRIVPRIRLGFGDQRISTSVRQHLQYRFIYVRQDYGQGIDFDDFVWEEKTRTYGVHELKYEWERTRDLVSGHIEGTVHAGKGFVRMTADARQRFIYHKSDKAIYMHAFGGILPYLESPEANINFNFNGIQSTGTSSRDYLYDEVLFSRTATEGLASQLVFLKDAQLKTLYNGGISDRWMVAAGIAVETPLPIPVQPYFDLAVYHDPFEDNTGVSFSGGVAIVIQKDVFEIYIPLMESKVIRNSLTYLERDTILKRISVMVDLKAFHPFKYNGY